MLRGPGVPLTSNGGIIRTGNPLPGGSAVAADGVAPDGAVATPGAGTRRCDNATTAMITISATIATRPASGSTRTDRVSTTAPSRREKWGAG